MAATYLTVILIISTLLAPALGQGYGVFPTKGKKHRTTTTTLAPEGADFGGQDIQQGFPNPISSTPLPDNSLGSYQPGTSPQGGTKWWQNPNSPFSGVTVAPSSGPGPAPQPQPQPGGCGGAPGAGCGGGLPPTNFEGNPFLTGLKPGGSPPPPPVTPSGQAVACSTRGYVCAPTHLCRNGVVIDDGQGILQVRSEVQYCNAATQVCCRLPPSTPAGCSGYGPGGGCGPQPQQPGVVPSQPTLIHVPPPSQPGLIHVPPSPRPNPPPFGGQSNAGTGLIHVPPPQQPSGGNHFPSASIPSPTYTPGNNLGQSRPIPGSNGLPIGGSIYDNFPVTQAPQHPYTGPLNTTPYPGCAAALKCVPESYCTMDGVMSDQPVSLTREQYENKVPLSDCADPDTGVLGKCCRDPNYKDPWPGGMMMMKNNGGAPQQQNQPDECGAGASCLHPYQCSNERKVQPIQNCRVPLDGASGMCCANDQSSFPGGQQGATFLPGSVPVAQKPVKKPIPGYPSPKPFPQPVPSAQPFPQQVQPVQPLPQQRPFPQQVPSSQFPQQKPGVTQPFPQQVPSAQPFPQQRPGVQTFPTQNYPSSQTSTQHYPSPQPSQPVPSVRPPQPQPQFPQQQPSQFPSPQPSQPQPSYPSPQPSQPQPSYPSPQPSQPQPSYPSPQPSRPQPSFPSPQPTQPQPQFPQQPSQPHFPSPQPQPSQPQPSFPSQPSQPQFPQQQPSQPHFPSPQPQPSLPQTQYPSQSQTGYPQPGQPSPVPGAECGIRRQVSRQGLTDVDAGFGECPWHALVVSNVNKSALCSAAIISDTAVVTAAHCLHNVESSDIAIQAGVWKLHSRNQPKPVQVVPVAAIARHPNFDAGSLFNDLAVLLLAHPLKFDQHIDKICLPPSGQNVPKYQRTCIATGWGKGPLQGNIPDSILHQVTVSVIPQATCEDKLRQTHLGRYFILNPSFQCAIPTVPAQDLCKVDVGGPIACDRGDGHHELSGTYSWDVGCTAANSPTVFGGIDTAWIESVLARPVDDVVRDELNEILKQQQQQELGVDAENKPGLSQGYGKK